MHGFEDAGVFEGCMPVEVMARRGLDTLRYGPLKPVGLKDPKTRGGALCRGAAAQGQRPGLDLQHRGLSDPPALAGAEAGILHDPRPEKRRVHPLWRDAPQYLPGLPPAAGPVLPGEGPGAADVLRPDHRRGGLCGVHRLRLPDGHGAAHAAWRASPPSTSPGRRPWGPWPCMSATPA